MTVALDDLEPGKRYTILYRDGTLTERRNLRGVFRKHEIDTSREFYDKTVLWLYFCFGEYPRIGRRTLYDYDGCLPYHDVICIWEEPP